VADLDVNNSHILKQFPACTEYFQISQVQRDTSAMCVCISVRRWDLPQLFIRFKTVY